MIHLIATQNDDILLCHQTRARRTLFALIKALARNKKTKTRTRKTRCAYELIFRKSVGIRMLVIVTNCCIISTLCIATYSLSISFTLASCTSTYSTRQREVKRMHVTKRCNRLSRFFDGGIDNQTINFHWSCSL